MREQLTSAGPDVQDVALDDFWDAHRRPLAASVRRRFALTEHDVQDVLQEAWIGLSCRWPALRTDEHRRRSLYTIANNAAKNLLRARRVELARGEAWLANEPERVDDDPAAALCRDAAYARLWREVDALPSERRTALLAHVALDLPYDYLAAMTGRTAAALRKDVSRAVRAVRAALEVAGAALAALVAKCRRPASGTTAASYAVFVGLAVGLSVVQLRVAPVPRQSVQTTRTDGAGSTAQTATAHGSGSAVPRSRQPGDRTPSRRPPDTIAPLAQAVREWHPPDKTNVPSACTSAACGETVVVRAGGREHRMGQSFVKTCWAMPKAAAPHVSCRERARPE